MKIMPPGTTYLNRHLMYFQLCTYDTNNCYPCKALMSCCLLMVERPAIFLARAFFNKLSLVSVVLESLRDIPCLEATPLFAESFRAVLFFFSVVCDPEPPFSPPPDC